MKKLSLIIFMLLFLPGLAFGQGGRAWYVDILLGDNSNPGTSALPLETIQAGADSMDAGDSVVVIGGTEAVPVDYDERV